jgi:hypothetical protein
MKRFVIRQNIEHYWALLDVTAAPSEQGSIEQLLREEEAKLKKYDEDHKVWMTERHYATARPNLTALPPKSPMLSKGAGPVRAAIDLRRRLWHGTPDRKLVGRPRRPTTAQESWNVVRPSQTHSQARSAQTTRTEWCAWWVPSRSNRPKSPKAGQADTDAKPSPSLDHQPLAIEGLRMARPANLKLLTDFFNKIDPLRRSRRRKPCLKLRGGLKG